MKLEALLPEDESRYIKWKEGMQSLSLEVIETSDRTCLLAGSNGLVIAALHYDPKKPYNDRFRIVSVP